ncbi:uncharacterized protein EI90DRAFT_1395424 [Cantharellus anzutake]|uniref:uncharacterized protein n=1 Tax=Cantharellus anzutake TaxID=1750568 RepID=UPI0019047ACB|nr:uncharacterized protein EI90DRAFT_1395424 [Cantharellus anzutake]KAF8329430.1 hypothetical protein EI90DRAFT_1395424 [Cantharellus anzutake]
MPEIRENYFQPDTHAGRDMHRRGSEETSETLFAPCLPPPRRDSLPTNKNVMPRVARPISPTQKTPEYTSPPSPHPSDRTAVSDPDPFHPSPPPTQVIPPINNAAVLQAPTPLSDLSSDPQESNGVFGQTNNDRSSNYNDGALPPIPVILRRASSSKRRFANTENPMLQRLILARAARAPPRPESSILGSELGSVAEDEDPVQIVSKAIQERTVYRSTIMTIMSEASVYSQAGEGDPYGRPPL